MYMRILRSVPPDLSYAERCRLASPEKIGLDRVHTSLKRQRVLQRIRTEGHGGLLVDAREQVLDSFFRCRSGKRPSSHMGKHLRAAIIVCDGHPAIVVGSARCDTDRS